MSDGLSIVSVHRRSGVTQQEAEGAVPPVLMRSMLERWLRSAPNTLRSLYEAVGGTWPWTLTRLEQTAHEQRVVNRLAEAFETGALVAIVEQRRHFVDSMLDSLQPELEELDWTPPPPVRPKPVPVESNLDAAAQALILRQAARDGIPFCEECQKRKQQDAAA